MWRSLVATCAVALLSDHVVQGYRVNSKKLMTSPESVLSKTRPAAPNVLHAINTQLGKGNGVEQAKKGEKAAEVEPSANRTLLAGQGMNTSASSEETVDWEPQGVLVKIGYLRSKVILHVASLFLPTSMVQKLPAMDALKVFDVPVVANSYLGLSWDRWEGKSVFLFVGAGLIVTIFFLVKFFAGIVAARAKPLAEGDDDNIGSAMGEIAGLALPMLVASLLHMLNEITNTIILGQKGTPVQLASLGLVQSLYNCAIITVGMGLNSVMDTVVSQAYGAGNQQLCVTYMNQCRFLVLCLLVILLPLFWFSEETLLLVGQEADVAAGTATPAKLFWLGGFFNQMTTCTFIFLKNIGDLSTIWMFAAGNVVHLGCAFFFALYLEMGATGIGIAMASQNLVLTLLMQWHLIWRSAVKDFPLVEKIFTTGRAFRGICDYIVIAIPAALSQACESWYWELNTMIIGWLGAVSLASHSSTMSLIQTCLIVCACTAGSGTTLVSRALGAGHPRAARVIAFWSILTIIFLWCIVGVLVLIFVHPLARAFNSHKQVLDIMYLLIRIQAIAGVFSCGQLIAGSVLKAMLKHRMVAIIQFCNYYIVALPVGYFLGFPRSLGAPGVYFGFIVGMTLSALTLIGVTSFLDFDRMTEETRARLEKDAAPRASETKKVDEKLG